MKRRKYTGGSAKAAFYKRFVDAFFSERENATRAYLAVKPHVTERSAGTEGHKLLKIPEIQKAIEARREEIRKRFAFTAERTIQELARVAYFNPQKIAGADGKPRALHEIDEDTAAALTLELDGKGNILKMRTPPPAAKNTAVKQAVKILRLEDKPPPPPPEPTGGAHVDERDLARRMAFILGKEAHTAEREANPQPKPVKKKVSLPA